MGQYWAACWEQVMLAQTSRRLFIAAGSVSMSHHAGFCFVPYALLSTLLTWHQFLKTHTYTHAQTDTYFIFLSYTLYIQWTKVQSSVKYASVSVPIVLCHLPLFSFGTQKWHEGHSSERFCPWAHHVFNRSQMYRPGPVACLWKRLFEPDGRELNTKKKKSKKIQTTGSAGLL